MKIFLSLVIVVVLTVFSGCKENSRDSIPRIILTEGQNKQYTYTNKLNGFFIGNSHRENSSINEGWTVNTFHYLKDYRLFQNEKQVLRDSLIQFIYYPFSAVRIYSDQIIETFTMLDSIDALVWEIEFDSQPFQFYFEPVLHQIIQGKQIQLSASNRHIVFSPKELRDSSGNITDSWLGFELNIEQSNRMVIIAAIETDEQRLNHKLDQLSQTYPFRIEDRRKRISEILRRNDTYTNIPELTHALSWAQISLDALITETEVAGIRVGLPFSNDFRGRETFISFAGAFLVNGQFNQAREVQDAFSRVQLTSKDDRWQGRIPDYYTKNEVIYSTSDVTWWYIRAAYQYLLYTGDMDIMQQVYPHIKLAIEGAIHNRIDKNFFLTHGDNETWMNISGAEGAWSPRGNRAVEIQALWYTALQIGAKFAEWNNDIQLREHWLAISETLKKNFIHSFWNSFKGRMADHLNSDESSDKKVRPNQIFTVYVPQLPGLKSFIEEDIAAQVINSVVQNLTYRYGVASLSQEDVDFHPWYHHYPFYTPQEASHNGPVWTWLAGPVISSLLTVKRENLAFDLYYDEAIQILKNDAIGNYAELKDVLPRPGLQEPQVSGNLSQAWSLAEFNRNFYQDFIGFQPDALNKRIYLYPNFSKDLNYVSTILMMGLNKYLFTYVNEEDLISFEIKLIEGNEMTHFFFEYPGYDPFNFILSSDHSVYHIDFDPKRRRSYHIYSEMDWYMAQPELYEGLKSLSKPDYPVLTSKDYFFPPGEKGKNLLQEKDILFDDTGSNRRYSYPLNPVFQSGIFDIQHFQIEDLNDSWGFILQMRNLVNPNWRPECGFQLTFAAIAIHNSDLSGNGRKSIEKNAFYTLSNSRDYHQIIYIGEGLQIEDSKGKIKAQYIPDDYHLPLGFTNRREIRFKIDKSFLPELNKNSVITVLAGGQDNPTGTGIGEFRLIKKTRGEWHGGGADRDFNACRVYDYLEIN